MNKEEIKKILPHREPMLLVETAELIAVEGAEGQKQVAVGSYTVKGDEWFLQGHFPGNPVVPGVVLCEMMAQNCCVLLAGVSGDGSGDGAGESAGDGAGDGSSAEFAATPMYTGLTNVKFRNPVKPGDTIKLECSIERVKEPFYFAKGKGSVDGKLCVSGEFSFAMVK